MKLTWTRPAIRDLLYLYEYIAEDNYVAANRMVARIRESAERLRKYPYMGKAGRIHGTYELVIAGSPYIVVYMLDNSEVQILAVIHSAMRWPDTFTS